MSAAQALARAGVTTANDLMGMARTDVCNKARISNEVYQSLLQHASMPFLPQMYAASEWREQQNVRSLLFYAYSGLTSCFRRVCHWAPRLSTRSSAAASARTASRSSPVRQAPASRRYACSYAPPCSSLWPWAAWTAVRS